ncbi:MAG: hypothetical protein HZC42_12815 [Candidatus Eisenbacteria bacterium]|nr:hypothetical protein [Candidatus Eisenbacteria bacterium]
MTALLAVLTGRPALWAQGPPASAADPTEASAFCARPTIVGRTPRGAVLDTVWYKFGPAFSGCRVVNKKRLWIVDDPWFGIPGGPQGAFKMPELDSLHEIGVLTDSSRFDVVTYRYTVKAGSPSEARRMARLKRTTIVPPAVSKALRRAARAATDGVTTRSAGVRY